MSATSSFFVVSCGATTLSSSTPSTRSCMAIARLYIVFSCGATIGILDVGSFVETSILDVATLVSFLDQCLVLIF
jgi:hypothetical protein